LIINQLFIYFNTINNLKILFLNKIILINLYVLNVQSFGHSSFNLVKNGRPYNETFLQLEYFMLSSLSGNKILLLIDEENNSSFFSEKDAVEAYFHFDEASSPLIILPFFLYVRRMFKRAKEESLDSTIKELYKDRLTEKEKKILNIISEKKYESITIKKQNGEINTNE